MAHHKRKRSSKRSVASAMDTDRWFGNNKGRFKTKETVKKKLDKKQIEKFSKVKR